MISGKKAREQWKTTLRPIHRPTEARATTRKTGRLDLKGRVEVVSRFGAASDDMVAVWAAIKMATTASPGPSSSSFSTCDRRPCSGEALRRDPAAAGPTEIERQTHQIDRDKKRERSWGP